ncbi:MAG TPA: MFS transporter [Syntrophales bacterium]|nr:MFS transporter [Syntrophales bacterium]
MPVLKKTGLHYGWAVLAVVTLAVFCALGLARFAYAMVLPAMQAALGMNNTQAGLLATFNMAGYLIFVLLGGALSTRYGARLVVFIGLGFVGLGMIGTGMAEGFLSVSVWRTLTGIATGGANIAAMGLLSSWFSNRRRGLASGVAVAGSSFALILTGRFVPWVGALQGADAWRACWIVFGCVSMLAALVAWLVLRNRPSDMGLGAIGDEESLRAESAKPAEAICWADIYLSAPVWSLGLIYSAFGFSFIIYMTFFFKFLIQDAGYTEPAAGALFMVVGWVSLSCGVIWGSVSDSVGRKKALIIVFLIHAIAFGFFGAGDAPVWFTMSAVLYGLSAWSVPAIMNAACGDLLGPRLAPAALGFITLFFGVGTFLGPAVGGMIADAAGAFSPAFLLASAVALLGAAGSAVLIKGK